MNQIRIGWASRDVSTDKPVNIPGQFHMRISEGVLEKGFPEEKCLVFDKLEEAVSYAYAIKGQGHKYILLENDLTDNY